MSPLGRVAVTILLSAVSVSCSGGSSDDGAAPTAPGTVPSRGDSSGSQSETTLPLLDADLAAANEEIVYPSAIIPSANPDRQVPAELATDQTSNLSVASAELRDGNGVYELVWILDNGVPCVNCAFVETRVRAIIAAVMAQPFASGISEVRGADPSRRAAADYAGRGWQADFVMASPEAGDQLYAFITSCEGESCRSGDLKVGEVIWQNKVVQSAACGNDLGAVVPNDAFPVSIDEIPAGSAADAGLDRVIVASPSFRPVLRADGDGFVVAGWNETGCAS